MRTKMIGNECGIKELKRVGKEMTTIERRCQRSWEMYENRMLQVEQAKMLRAKGKTCSEICGEMGLNESTVRSLLNPKHENQMAQVIEVVNFLRDKMNIDGMVDVSSYMSTSFGISRQKLELALYRLNKFEKCPVYVFCMDQTDSNEKRDTRRFLCKPGTRKKDVFIQTI